MIQTVVHIPAALSRWLEQGGEIEAASAEAMHDSVLYVLSRVPTYPPAPATSHYVRTGTLGRSLTGMQGNAPLALSRVESLGSEVQGIVGSNVVYAPEVIDRDRQIRGMQHRWWTLQDVVEQAVSGVAKVFAKSLGRRFPG